MTMTAPADGTIFYGKIEDGKWSPANTAKFLYPSGKLPTKKTFMTFVPKGSPLELHTFLSQKDWLNLKVGIKGTATISGLDGQHFPLVLESITDYPTPDLKYHVKFSVTLPDNHRVVTGMKSKITLVSYRKEDALTVPENAVKQAGNEYSVRVKLANGEDENRQVTIGKKSNGKIEILSGLSAGQVILLPKGKK